MMMIKFSNYILLININQNVICLYMVFSSLRKTQGTPGHRAECDCHASSRSTGLYQSYYISIICQSDYINCVYIHFYATLLLNQTV